MSASSHSNDHNRNVHEGSSASQAEADISAMHARQTSSQTHEDGSTGSSSGVVDQSSLIMQRARYHALGVMAKHIFNEACSHGLMEEIRDNGQSVKSPFHPSFGGSQTPGVPTSASALAASTASAGNLNVVALRAAKHQYATWPTTQQPDLLAFLSSLSSLNVGAALTIRNAVSEGLLELISPDSNEVILSTSKRIQVIQSPADLTYARKAQGLAFVRSIKAVVIWSDEASKLLEEAVHVHQNLLKFFWQIADDGVRQEEDVSPEEMFNRSLVRSQFKVAQTPLDVRDTPANGSVGGGHAFHTYFSSTPVGGSVGPSSLLNVDGVMMPEAGSSFTPSTSGNSSTWGNSNGQLVLQAATPNRNGMSGGGSQEEFGDEEAIDLETGEDRYINRPVMFIAPIQHALAFILAVVLAVLSIRQALYLGLLDGNWTRMAIIPLSPVIFGLTMFLSDNIIGIVVMLFGPVRQLHENSRYYSGKRPKQLQPRPGKSLPHITVQMPVYKESLVGVLKPSFESIKKAIRTYELQGGSAAILVSEDGMAAISDDEERQARLAYYEENNITWIARPKHGDDGFIREGRFKKASNLNFSYEILQRVDDEMRLAHPEFFEQEELHAPAVDQDGTQDPFASPASEQNLSFNRTAYKAAYDSVLQRVLQSVHPRACGSGHTAMGQFILLVDSDTRIPEDCFLDAASELTQSKDVGVLQHCSGVMYVSSSFFESAIGYFTTMINFAITYCVANGDVSPFMGHNAYLRWSAMQEIAKSTYDEEKGTLKSYKIWSDEHVSEDFVMALDMMDKGYIIRWATYADRLYEEGVSLTCTDELNRWQKYAWGVSEMLFHKIHVWWRRGPITPLCRRLLFGTTPIHYKFSSLSYCLSYYAIAVAVPGCIALTLVKGWIGFNGMNIPTTFEVFVATVVVFLAGCSVVHTIVQFRAGYGSFVRLAFDRIKYMPFMIFFFGGLPYHVLLALLAHLFNINMTWGATIKDWTASNVFSEIPILLRQFWTMLTLFIVVIVGISVCTATSIVPLAWQLSGVYDLFPVYFLAGLHILYPFVLNPNLLRFSF